MESGGSINTYKNKENKGKKRFKHTQKLLEAQSRRCHCTGCQFRAQITSRSVDYNGILQRLHDVLMSREQIGGRLKALWEPDAGSEPGRTMPHESRCRVEHAVPPYWGGSGSARHQRRELPGKNWTGATLGTRENKQEQLIYRRQSHVRSDRAVVFTDCGKDTRFPFVVKELCEPIQHQLVALVTGVPRSIGCRAIRAGLKPRLSSSDTITRDDIPTPTGSCVTWASRFGGKSYSD
ncbi:hypothetical protein J6590_010058 [Homalodisca vitripennis]|nr:hypothetical protein J6590_010058 [Homalodisca vitripennis]